MHRYSRNIRGGTITMGWSHNVLKKTTKKHASRICVFFPLFIEKLQKSDLIKQDRIYVVTNLFAKCYLPLRSLWQFTKKSLVNDAQCTAVSANDLCLLSTFEQNYAHGAGDYDKMSLFSLTSAQCQGLYSSQSNNDQPADSVFYVLPPRVMSFTHSPAPGRCNSKSSHQQTPWKPGGLGYRTPVSQWSGLSAKHWFAHCWSGSHLPAAAYCWEPRVLGGLLCRI